MEQKDSAAADANAGQEWDLGGDEKKEVEVKDEKKEADPKHEEQVERTKLGRKVKEQEEKLSSIVQQNQQLMETVQRLETLLQKDKPATNLNPNSDLFDQMVAAAGEPPVEFVTTPRETYLYQQWQEKALKILNESTTRVYRDGYLGTINNLKEIGGELHEEIVKMTTTKNAQFNVYRDTGRGDVDARINYLEALNFIQSKDKQSFGKSTQNKSGVSSGQTSDISTQKSAKLSEDAMSYAKHIGMSDEDIAEAMKRPIGRVG